MLRKYVMDNISYLPQSIGTAIQRGKSDGEVARNSKSISLDYLN